MFIKEKEKFQKVIQVPLSWIRPNPHQPRTQFDEDELKSLADSIRENGLLQPLTVRKKDEDCYELIAGERRLRAARLLELSSISCIVMDMSDRNAAVLALVENIQRKDLNFFDESAAIAELIEIHGLTQEDAAIKLGKAQSTIANKLRLLKLLPEERRYIIDNKLTERHARAVLKLTNPDERIAILKMIVKYNYNVEKTESIIDNFLTKTQLKADFEKRKGLFRDVRLFMNTINKAIETMKAAGVPANSSRINHEDCIEYRVFIPIKSTNA